MALKTNYKDDAFDGTRQYRMVTNDNGTVSFVDVTEYSQVGDTFGASDINATNHAVNEKAEKNHTHRIPGWLVTLKASNWIGSSIPYSQTVTVPDITADDNPLLVRNLADGASESEQKAYNAAFSIIISGTGTTANGSVTFKVYKKPTIDITVGLKGCDIHG